MSSLFQSYESEIVTLLDGLRSRSVRDDSHAYMDSLAEIEALVRQLDLESRNSTSSSSSTRQRVSQLKESVQHLKAKAEHELLMLRSSTTTTKDQQTGRYDEEDDFEVMDRTSETLLGATRTLYETEGVAVGIGQDLLNQRATILSAKEKMFSVSGLLNSAQRSMRSLQDVDVRQRAIAYSAVAFSLLLLVIYVCTALSKHMPSTSSSSTDAPTTTTTTSAPSSL